MSDPIGFAMVGCGGIAMAHLEAIAKLPEARLAAAVDVVVERAESVATQYGVPAYTDYERALADPDVEAVLLALPHHLHLPYTVQAAKAGKHVLVEKPMALNLAEARQMAEAAQAAGVRLMVGQSTRFQPQVWALKQAIAAGRLGEVRQCIYERAFFLERLSTPWRYSREQSGGLYLPLFASHDVDMIRWLMEEQGQPRRVHCTLRYYTPVVDAESDGMIGIEFAGGGIASVAFTMNSRISRWSSLYVGTEATALIDGRENLWINDARVELDDSLTSFDRPTAEFVAAIREGREPSPSGRYALGTMAVLDAARASAESGQSVEIDPAAIA